MRDFPTRRARSGCTRTCCAGRWVLAVAGTHGKTTTSSMLAWILEHAGLSPGFLIGGVPENFGISARLSDSAFFVIEADEYDTAFFDKRSKFVHYRPRTAILNNLEYDHADIFPDVAAIETQFHHLVRTVPRVRAARRQRRGGEPRPRAGARRVVGDRAPRRCRVRAARRRARAGMADRVRWRRDAPRRAAGRRALAERSSAARPPQPVERARRARRRRGTRVSGSPPGSPRSPSSAASSAVSKRSGPRTASPSTTISRIIRRRSRRPSTGCGTRSAARGSSPCWSRARTR